MSNPNHQPQTRLNQCNLCPPFLAYALARSTSGGVAKRLSLQELVERSGLPERTFMRTAQKTSWDHVKFGVMVGFLGACGVDPMQFRKHRRFLRNHRDRLPYLTDRQWQSLNDKAREAINSTHA